MNTRVPPGQEVEGVVPGAAGWWRGASLGDLFGARGHSDDFNGLRASYIALRVRLLSFIFAALAPLWIPIDYLFLDQRLFLSLLALRLAFSGLYLGLGLWTPPNTTLQGALRRLFGFLLIPGLFYVASRLLMDGTASEEAILVGYSFLPFLLVGLLAVFPLTLLEGISAALFVGAFLLASELYAGTLWTLPSLANLWLLGLLAIIALWAELTQLHMLLRLYREATRDTLTRLVNRRVLNRWLEAEVVRAGQSGRALSLMLLDLDLFKRINDTHGHLTGDAVLRAFAELLQREAETPMVGRYGGEEFLAILPGVEAGAALEVAERIREGCRRLRVIAADGHMVPFTTSIGVAQWLPGETAEQLVARVDQALYQAKEAGRNAVTLASAGTENR